jgi:glycosyltransferase involved in cell wall biosynthesis
MKITVSAPRLALTGGIERYTTELAIQLSLRGNQVTALCDSIGSDVPPSVVIEQLRSIPLSGLPLILAEAITFGSRSRRRMQQLPETDIVYGPLGSVFTRGVVTAHSCHASWLHDREMFLGRQGPNPLDRIFLRQEKRTYNSSGLVLTTVSHRCAKGISDFYGIDEHSISVVPPAINQSNFKPVNDGERAIARRKFGVGENDFVVGTVANYAFARKRVNATIEAATASGATVLVAGVPDRSATTTIRTAESQGAKLKLLGGIENMNDFYATLDVFALPSINEAYGMAAHEAMARSIPTIISAECGISDFLTPGIDAVVLPDEPAEIVANLAGAIELLRNSDRAVSLGNAGASWAAKRNWVDVASELELILQRAGADPS